MTPTQPLLVRRKTTSLVRGLTDKIDDLLGTERTDENRRFSTLRVSLRHRIVDSGASDTSAGVRLMLRPATFDQWQGQVDQWLKRKKVKARDRLWSSGNAQTLQDGTDETASTNEPATDEESERDPWRPAFEQRFRLDRSNFYEGRLKITKDLELQNTLHHGVYDVRWSTQRRWESVLSTISSYPLSDDLLFQFTNAFNWQITGRNFESSHGLNLAYTISSDRAISFSTTAAVGYDPWWVNVYTISSVYRQHIFEDWIDFSVNPYQSYARNRNFNAETGIVFNAEVIF